MLGFLKDRRRRRTMEAPFPPEWLAIVEKNVPLYGRLDEDDREALLDHVQVFLAEKRFEGAGGLEMTDEIRVTIAAQACIPLLHLDDADYYGRLRSVVVYPSTYVVPQETQHGGVVREGESARLGESWDHGAVVLAWDSARTGAANPADGRNVVLHEFAHQLDQADGGADGTPVLPLGGYVPFARVLGEHYLELRDDREDGRKTLLNGYGATSEAEFFAVATETFFEKPVQLERRHPELYAELARYFRQDPAAEVRARAGEGDDGPKA